MISASGIVAIPIAIETSHGRLIARGFFLREVSAKSSQKSV